MATSVGLDLCFSDSFVLSFLFFQLRRGSLVASNVNSSCDPLTARPDLARSQNAGTKSASCNQADAAPAWRASC